MTIWTRVKELFVDPRRAAAVACWQKIERDSEIWRSGGPLFSALIDERRELDLQGKRVDDYLIGLSPEHSGWEFVRHIAERTNSVPQLAGFPIVQDAELHGEAYRLVRVA